MFRPNGLEYYETVLTGEIALTSVSNQFPDVPSYLVRFKARKENIRPAFVGPLGVTVPDGVTDQTTGLQMDAQDDSGWMLVRNLNNFYGLASGGTAGLTYIILR